MCGVFGLISNREFDYKSDLIESAVNCLFKMSESRGKESAGAAYRFGRKIKIYKRPISASCLVASGGYKKLLSDFSSYSGGARAILGHTRLMTDGASEKNQNNQPVIRDGLVCAHNGIIVNASDLWRKFSLKREYEVDTEIILSLIKMFVVKGDSLPDAVKKTFSFIKGSASIAVLFDDINYLLLATNTGSLYFCVNNGIFLFASERYILERIVKKRKFRKVLGACEITQIKSGSGYLVNIDDLDFCGFDFKKKENIKLAVNRNYKFNIIDISPRESNKKRITSDIKINLFDIDKAVLRQANTAVGSLKRCVKCILPETMPFIEFDRHGVCNYCRNYSRSQIKGEEELKKFIEKYKRKDNSPDCVVSFSGGRDSSYGLHYVKRVLGINPVAYSYDWGMITDLGRRNQARMCGKLGVEHILVSADIRKKREHIRKNVVAWLKKPDLGLVPLFMAGDKQFFYYANQLRKQTKTKLIIFCESPLEKTYFKSGFCGIKPIHDTNRIYALSFLNKIKLASYYLRGFLANYQYINISLIDTLSAYACYYLIHHDFLFLFQYINWNEDEMMSVLFDDYDWETAKDTQTTWRIGDATTPFYNYIYYMMAGFTENDTLRSNQIREGVINREQALELVKQENQPRYESIKWYCDAINVDFRKAVETIDSARRLYKF